MRAGVYCRLAVVAVLALLFTVPAIPSAHAQAGDVRLDCMSEEEDGSITDANPTPAEPVVLCGGFIGDGAYGETSGDADFYALNAVSAGSTIELDVTLFDEGASSYAFTLGVYTEDGSLIATVDRTSNLPSSVSFEAPVTDNYYLAVVGLGELPADPFDPASGDGVMTHVGEYFVYIGVYPSTEGFPDPGSYTLTNVNSGQFLDADRDGSVNVSNIARADDVWDLIPNPDGLFNLRNVFFGTYLDGDANGAVDQSTLSRDDDRWRLTLADDSSEFFLYNLEHDGYLSQVGTQVVLSAEQTDAEKWTFAENVVAPPVGSEVTLQNAQTGRWLDGDPDGSVNQSVVPRSDDVWRVLDAGDGFVYLQNTVSGRYLDADATDGPAETSAIPRSDDRWELIGDGPVAIRNVDHGGYLTALGFADAFDTVTQGVTSAATTWEIVAIEPG